MDPKTLNTIRGDLRDTSNERLQQWLTDSLELYRMGHQKYGIALADTLFSLATALAVVADLADLKPSEVHTIISSAYDSFNRVKNQEESH